MVSSPSAPHTTTTATSTNSSDIQCRRARVHPPESTWYTWTGYRSHTVGHRGCATQRNCRWSVLLSSRGRHRGGHGSRVLTIYVYTDVVESRIVGDSLAPLLRSLPVGGSRGATVHYRFTNIHYVPLLYAHFNSIEINRDDTGRFVPFEYGKVTVTFSTAQDRTVLKMNYNEYYAHQAGGALPYFAGAQYQRGHGVGTLFGGLLRSAMPLKRGAVALGKGALKTGVRIANDVMSGQSIKRRPNDASRMLVGV